MSSDKKLAAFASVFAWSIVLFVVPPAQAQGPFQVRYVANLDIGDAVVDLTNSGASGGNICANLYAFDPAEELISCCSCPVTPNGLTGLSVQHTLTSDTLTPALPTSVVVKIVASTMSGICNPATVPAANLATGLLAWGTSLHQNNSTVIPTYGVTETAFEQATLTTPELTHLTSTCAFIEANGSGFGICKGCTSGGR